MMLIIKLALRNLTRNQIRTILNLTMIIGAYASIVIFRGFANDMILSLENQATKGPAGQVQIAKQAIWDGELPEHKEMAYIEDHASIEERLKNVSGLKYSAGRADTRVLVSNGELSVGAQAIGFDPVIAAGVQKLMFFEAGQEFSGKNSYEILLGAGLQKQLHLKPGQSISVLGQTLAGSISSIDTEIRGVVKTGLASIDNSTVYLPLEAVQKLLGTKRVEQMSVVLNEGVSLKEGVSQVSQALKGTPELVVKDWRQTVTIFNKAAAFYGLQNLLVEIILSTLILFGILNTIGMSVFERIGEIGTMRALGDGQGEVLFLILFEGLTLGLVGSILGAIVSAILAFGISAMQIPILMPGSSRAVPVHISPFWNDFLLASAIVTATCLVSSVWPAVKATRLSIVDALRANS